MENDKDWTGEKPELDLKSLAKQWVSRFEGSARARKYPNLHKLFHESAVIMGLEANVCATLEQAIEREFKEVWPGQLAFTIDLSKAAMCPDISSIVLVAPWTSSGRIHGSPPKRGRITLVLQVFEAGKILCTHLHMSNNPGVSIEKA